MRKKPSLLWSFHREDFPGISYLFGTMHVHDRKAFGLIGQVESVLRNCDALATEYDLDDSDTFDSSWFKDLSRDKSVREVLPEKTWTKLRRILYKTQGIHLDAFQNAHPFVLIGTVSSLILSKDMPLSLDEHLWETAKAWEKQTIGIETLQEQLAIVGKIPIEAHVKNLAQIAVNFPRYRHQTLKMAEWYASGNLAQLHRASVKGQGSLKRLLLYDRNAIMADRIAAIAASQTTLFAVGAGHLTGKYGLVRLLKNQGFKLNPIRSVS
ncbi:MAG: TraB/GumN family protein [Saprospiraceae bacterium]|nr:TraB/GumN family protein [Saprospiraceae bacterium]MDZ4706715.1 TraB/GumN family protein [Saprospiraceae bacterium]